MDPTTDQRVWVLGAPMFYSEDGGKQVDLALLPGPYDLHLTAVTQNINTEPATAAVYKLWITNLGSEPNTVLV